MKLEDCCYEQMNESDIKFIRFMHSGSPMWVNKGFKELNMKEPKDCCYEEMTKSVGGQSEPSEIWNEPPENEYEEKRKSFYGKEGFDWSGMRKE
jgi:hypothetical protein